jgi:hypothetical protein
MRKRIIGALLGIFMTAGLLLGTLSAPASASSCFDGNCHWSGAGAFHTTYNNNLYVRTEIDQNFYNSNSYAYENLEYLNDSGSWVLINQHSATINFGVPGKWDDLHNRLAYDCGRYRAGVSIFDSYNWTLEWSGVRYFCY